jgi:hypothetical protein
MEINENSLTFLMADDDTDEYFLLKEGLKESHFNCDLRELKFTIQMAIRGENSIQSAKTQSRLRERKSIPMEQIKIPW